jgi:hypothetical protein
VLHELPSLHHPISSPHLSQPTATLSPSSFLLQPFGFPSSISTSSLQRIIMLFKTFAILSAAAISVANAQLATVCVRSDLLKSISFFLPSGTDISIHSRSYRPTSTLLDSLQFKSPYSGNRSPLPQPLLAASAFARTSAPDSSPPTLERSSGVPSLALELLVSPERSAFTLRHVPCPLFLFADTHRPFPSPLRSSPTSSASWSRPL